MLRIFLLALTVLSAGLMANETETVKVKAGKFLYKTELPGLILSADAEKIKVDSKNWQNWIVEEAVKHGQSVKKGDLLVRFESEAYEDALKAAKRNLETQKANLVKAQRLFEISMKKMDFEKKKAALTAEAEEKLALIYKEKGHEQAKINFEQDLVDARNSLLYQKEELAQLKKMYDEDKITEETEEIVLKRQQNYVNSLTRRIRTRELAVEEAMTVKLPNALFNSEYKRAKAKLDAEKTAVEWEIFALTERLKLDSQEEALKKAVKKLEELESDKNLLEIKASRDGIVVYGKISSGKWTNMNGIEYKKGKSFIKGSTLFSLVDPTKFIVEAKADYTQVQYIDERASFFVNIPGQGVKELSLKGKSSIPDNNTFKVTFELKESAGVYHGTAVKAKVFKLIGEMVISVPSKAVHADDDNPTKTYVNVVENSKAKKVYVETGLSHNGKTVITSGLNEGAEVKTK